MKKKEFFLLFFLSLALLNYNENRHFVWPFTGWLVMIR